MGGILRESLERAAKAVGAERREQRLLLEILSSELARLDADNRDAIEHERRLTGEYEAVRDALTPQERDAFLLAVLQDLCGLADQSRAALRVIVAQHMERSRTTGEPAVSSHSVARNDGDVGEAGARQRSRALPDGERRK